MNSLMTTFAARFLKGHVHLGHNLRSLTSLHSPMTTKAHEASLSEIPPLDPSKLDLSSSLLDFMKRHTSIEDESTFRQRIIAVQQEAYNIVPYPCIHNFSFLKVGITKFAAYKHILELGRKRPGMLFLDIGCCFGTDSRKLVDDGFPASQVIASDFHAEFWRLGNQLFGTTDGIRFLAGDVFSDALLNTATAPLPTPPTSLNEIESLTPLLGHISAIYAGLLFHLFSEERQTLLARRLLALLRPQPGSVIFGAHVFSQQSGMLQATNAKMFCHSPETWGALWLSIGEENGVRLETKTSLAEHSSTFMQAVGESAYLMDWEVWVA